MPSRLGRHRIHRASTSRGSGLSAILAVIATAVATLAVLTLVGCRDASEIPEAGALMLRINAAPSGERPTELRVWAYADEGVVFNGTRFPEQGTLPATVGSILGSILVSPGNVTGNLRIYVRGLDSGLTVQTGAVVLPPALRNRTTVDVFLDAPSVHDTDTDGDGVPDEIDDCPTVSNPQQLGCPQGGAGPDGSVGGMAPPASDDAGASGGSSSGGTSGYDAAVPIGGSHGAGAATGGAGAGTGSGGASSIVVDGGSSHEDRPAALDAPAAADGAALPEAGSPGQDPDAGSGGIDAAIPFTKRLGSPCRASLECQSLFCADGVCCNAACDRPCQACLFGFCLAVLRMPDVPECTGTMTCNQAAMCVPGP